MKIGYNVWIEICFLEIGSIQFCVSRCFQVVYIISYQSQITYEFEYELWSGAMSFCWFTTWAWASGFCGRSPAAVTANTAAKTMTNFILNDFCLLELYHERDSNAFDAQVKCWQAFYSKFSQRHPPVFFFFFLSLFYFSFAISLSWYSLCYTFFLVKFECIFASYIHAKWRGVFLSVLVWRSDKHINPTTKRTSTVKEKREKER